MYPETDIPPIPVAGSQIERIRSRLPERPSALRARLEKDSGLDAELVRQLVAGDDVEIFETLVRTGRSPPLVARLLIQDLPAVPWPDATPDREFSVRTLDEVVRAAEEGRFAKEGIPAVLARLAQGAETVAVAAEQAGLAGLSSAELDTLIDRIVHENARLVRERGAASSFSPLMGDVMREVRGRRDGQEVAAALRRAIDRVASAPPA